jgi:transcription-repair coupling factor (superfamily II helicase)
MSEHELENIMVSFVEGEEQVLVCTTIVETGLDIPNVNTIIIQNADYMGLSQLYQLRGRVGRANRLAYAYLMYRKDKILEEVAQKRLQTIRDFTEFGSGFKIAMRDLEIRGAGNVLGGEQHGHMDAVGYDMYCRLLAEAVAELQGRTQAQVFDTSIDVQVNAYIPEYYIEDEVQKLEMYKKISLIRTEGDKDDTYDELQDRFGNPPSPVENLLRVSHLKARANKIGITAITQKQKQLVLNFKNDAEVDVDNLSTYISQEAGRITFTMSPSPYITSYIKEGVGVLDEVSNILTGLEGATNE